MAIKYLGNQRYQGLSTDSKPTNVPIGAEFEEENTGNKFYWDNSNWILYTTGGGGSGGGGILPASYTIYKGSDNKVKALNGLTGVTDYTTVTSPTGVQTKSLFQSVVDALAPTGGRLDIKRGLYMLGGSPWLVGDSVTYPGTSIYLKGEGYGATELRQADGGYGQGMVRPQCDFIMEDLMLNGNYADNGAASVTALLMMGWPTAHIKVNRCKFQKAAGFGFRVNTSGAIGATVTNCWFAEKGNQDQCSQGSVDYAIIANNLFDKRNPSTGGTTSGSCSTNGGSTKNIMIANNVFLRSDTSGGENAISVEAFNINHSDYLIANNICHGGRIYIGGQSAANGFATDYNMKIMNNQMHDGGAIQIDSSGDTTWPNTDITHIDISGNTIRKSIWGGIMLFQVAGPVTIRNNNIIEWNYSDVSSTSRAGIYVSKVTDLEISNNQLWQTDATGTNISKNAIRLHGGVTRCRIYDNKIYSTNGRTVWLLETTDGANSGVELWNNYGFKTNADGIETYTGDGSTTTRTVSHGLDVTPDVVTVTTNLSRKVWVTALGSTTFTVNFDTAPAVGTVNIYWRASKRLFA